MNDFALPHVFGDALVQYTIYAHPRDYPEGFVLRLWVIGRGVLAPTQWHQKGTTVAEVENWRDHLEARGFVCIPRSEGDDPVIMETWT